MDTSTTSVESLSPSSIMSPNTRQQKSRLPKELIQIFENWKLNTEDTVEVLILILKKKKKKKWIFSILSKEFLLSREDEK